jgi:hypothetical protein
MRKCKCGRSIYLKPEQRVAVREFKAKYPWVTQLDLSRLLAVSPMRISEIVRGLKHKGGL